MVELNEKHLGSTLDSFLEEQGTLGDTEAVAYKRVIACDIKRLMEENGVSISELARRMKTSRTTVSRLLDWSHNSVTLITLSRACVALDMRLDVQMVNDRQSVDVAPLIDSPKSSKESGPRYPENSVTGHLKEEGILGEVEGVALKRIISHQILDEMKEQKVSRSELARRMKTSRTTVSRLLDESHDSVTLTTLANACVALGKRVVVKMVEDWERLPAGEDVKQE